jgi:hypothetical protein
VSLDVSKPYRSSRLVTGIAFFYLKSQIIDKISYSDITLLHVSVVYDHHLAFINKKLLPSLYYPACRNRSIGSFFIASGVGLSPLYCDHFWPIVPAPDDR